ncbi:hypothetical protein WJX74_001477 [Apatococcus lobatus]|uniref:Uncharacterized protein n=2 Tax=Apatococcus TaxID=904362 RepID=A0AAW1STI5_9CHLO
MHTTDRDELCKPEEEEAASHAEAETGISGACSGTNGTASTSHLQHGRSSFSRIVCNLARDALHRLLEGTFNNWDEAAGICSTHGITAWTLCRHVESFKEYLSSYDSGSKHLVKRLLETHPFIKADPEAAAKHRKTAQNWSPIWDPRTRNAKELWYLSSVDELAEGIQMAWFCDLSQWSTQNTHNIIFPFEIHIPANSSEIHDPIGR